MKRLLLTLPMAALLTACGEGDVREVRDWMDQVRKSTHQSVKPLQAPKEFIPFGYTQRDAHDPFNPANLQGEPAPVAGQPAQPNQPDERRPKEVLEHFPLDAMRMVGSLQKSGDVVGLVQIDSQVYHVRKGGHIGQNFGLVTRVGETAIDIREVVQDAAGAWVPRTSRLELQESKEKGK